MLELRPPSADAQYWYSDGDGTFTPGPTITDLHTDSVVMAGDFDGNGCIDIVAQGSVNKVIFNCNPAASEDAIGNWIYGQDDKLVLGETNITRSTSFDYDPATGLLTQEVIQPNDSTLALTTDLGRDAYGNVDSVTRSGATVDTRSTTFSYDSNGRFIDTVTNAESQTDTYVFDARFGTLRTLTDPNSQSTSYLFDQFGRATRGLK